MSNKKDNKGISFFKLVLYVFGSFLVYRVGVMIHHTLMLKYPGTFYKDPYTQQSTVIKNCSEVSFEEVKTVLHIHNLKDAFAFISKYPYEPIIFKKFIKNPVEQWEKIEKYHANVNITVHDFHLYGFGNIFFGGGQPDMQSVDTTVGEIVNIVNDPASKRAMFGSFISFLDAKYEENSELKFFSDMKVIADTSFLSNFPEDILASPVHFATTINSYAVQYVGRKLWLMVPPNILEKFGIISTPSSFPLSGNEVDLFKHLGGSLPVAIQEEGDLFFFPPQWGHAVITKAGKNVMINYREFAPLKALLTNPFRCIEGGISGIMSRTNSVFRHHGLKLENELKRVEYQMNHRKTDGNTDSGCKDIWKEMLSR